MKLKDMIFKDEFDYYQSILEENYQQKELKKITKIIEFIDENVDGCGTDIKVLIKVTGSYDINEEKIIIKDKIKEFQEENIDEWDTDSVIDMVVEYLESKGYECTYIIPEIEITF